MRDTHTDVKAPEDTMSSESAVNLDQGDPLAEADFHMAYGLYDQAADLVRIALEREPDRRDLRLKLLEIYFVWGNKDAFLQTAKGLEATRDRAPHIPWTEITGLRNVLAHEYFRIDLELIRETVNGTDLAELERVVKSLLSD